MEAKQHFNKRMVARVRRIVKETELEDSPFTFMYHGSKTYVFGDLLVRLVDSWGYSLLSGIFETSYF